MVVKTHHETSSFINFFVSMYHQVKKENQLPSVEFSWSICVGFRWSIPVTSWWVVIVTSAVATRCGARSTAPSSRRSRTCLTRRRNTPCPSFSWPGHRWLTWTWRHTARWAPFTKNVSNIYSLIDLVMGREGGRCYCSLCDDRSLYYYVVFLFHMMSLSGWIDRSEETFRDTV